MAGILRWRNLQNIKPTEVQINLLEGLSITATVLNQLSGFTGTGEELNQAIISTGLLADHLAQDLSHAHPLLANSLDGHVLGDETIPLVKMESYLDILTQADIVEFENRTMLVEGDNTTLNDRMTNLEILMTGIQNDGLADVIDNLLNHIDKIEDAHDALAISLGNNYPLVTDVSNGNMNNFDLSLDQIKWFKIGDEVSLTDDISGDYSHRIVTDINYDTGKITVNSNLPAALLVQHHALIVNLSQKSVQTGVERSLRNTTDIFSGRLDLNQGTSNDQIRINHTGSGRTINANTLDIKTDLNATVELGDGDGTTSFILNNSSKRRAFSVADDGKAVLNNLSLEDRGTDFLGLITHQTLTSAQTWTLPNRSGLIGLGDLTFTELLKVSYVSGTKTFNISAGYKNDYQGQKIYAWTTMENGSEFDGGSLDLETEMDADGELQDLGAQWQVANIFITPEDTIGLMYGPREATKEEAISEFLNIVPSAYMKLAQIIYQGNGLSGGLSGVIQSSISILSDQRPILSMGVSSAFYDEDITYSEGLGAGERITLPHNSRAGSVRQTFKKGAGQLEVYLDGIYQEVNKDYFEDEETPEGKIHFNKNLMDDSVVRFRITYTSAAAGSALEATTLQDAYQAGPIIDLNDFVGPIEISSHSLTVGLIIEGNVSIAGNLYDTKSVELTAEPLEPGRDETSKLYMNSSFDLILKRFAPSYVEYYNITAEIEAAQKSIKKRFFNSTGSQIPAKKVVSLHHSLSSYVILTDVSVDDYKAAAIGITTEAIEDNTWGEVILLGVAPISGGFPHDTILVVDPANPGSMIPRNAYVETPTSVLVEMGRSNGSEIFLQVRRYEKTQKNTTVKKAGEFFAAGVAKAVRMAKSTETFGSVYLADKRLANSLQNFWVYGIVCPRSDIAAGEDILVNIYKETIHLPSAIFFSGDIGKPCYLGDNGDIVSYDAISYGSSDAIIKIGMIENSNKMVMDSIQMMGTQP